jgi:hypothetical protein
MKKITRTSKEFNVLCITKRRSDNQGWPLWHEPITGPAELITEGEVKEIKAVYKLAYIREGLSGEAIVLGIEIPPGDRPTYDIWELYTDTPTGKKTSKQIRKSAEMTIANRRPQHRAELATRQQVYGYGM